MTKGSDMKKAMLAALLVSFSCLAQQNEQDKLEVMHSNISAGRMFCSLESHLGGTADAVRKCKEDQIAKANGDFLAAKGRLEKNAGALAALKNYYAAALASLEQVGSADQRTEEQAAMRIQELFNLLKIELIGTH